MWLLVGNRRCIHRSITRLTCFLATICITYGFVDVSSLALRVFQTSSSSCSSGRRPLFAYVNIDENAPRDIGTFDAWAIACGVQRAEGVQLTPTTQQSPMDVGLVTTYDLAAQSPVVYVPNEMILSAQQARQEIGNCIEAEQRLVSSKASEYIPRFYLFLKILLEFQKGDTSPWYPWLNSLPRYYANGASMTPFCFECLPPLAGNLAMGERIQFIQFFQALKYINFLGNDIKESKELAKWAFAIAFTRGMDTPDGDFKVIPMVDYFNHGAVAQVQVNYDGQGNCHVYTTGNIPAGTQLCLTYADPTNPSFLFARYGFLDESSPASFCKIMISRPSQELKNLGYDYSRMLFYKDTGDVSPEVWDVLLYQFLEQSDPNVQQQFYRAHMMGDMTTKQNIHRHYFPQTSIMLQNHVDTFLRDLTKLSRKGDGKDLSEHPRLPLILQHNQFVEETFINVRAKLEQYQYS